MNYEHIIHENLAVVAIRGASALEYNFCFDGKPICAGLLDLLVPLYFINNKQQAFGIYFSDCDLDSEKEFWLKVLKEVATLLNLNPNQMKTHFLIENKKQPNNKKLDIELPLSIFSSHSDLTNYWDRVI
jgi:malate synthase